VHAQHVFDGDSLGSDEVALGCGAGCQEPFVNQPVFFAGKDVASEREIEAVTVDEGEGKHISSFDAGQGVRAIGCGNGVYEDSTHLLSLAKSR
jgi:hypothetical protein